MGCQWGLANLAEVEEAMMSPPGRVCLGDTYRDVASTRSVVCIVQRTHLGLGLVFEVQLHTLDAHVTSPCGGRGEGRRDGYNCKG